MLKPKTIIALTAVTALALGGCSKSEHLKSLDASLINDSIPAGTDFYEHVTQLWQQAHPLTAEYSRYGQFNVLNDSSEARVKDIITGLAATNPEPGSVAFKVSTIYNQAMDSARRNSEGAAPIQAGLQKIENTPHEGMADLFLWFQKEYGSPFMGAGPMENMVNSDEYAMYLSGGSMGLNDRDYYLKDDPRNTEVREAYKTLISSQLVNEFIQLLQLAVRQPTEIYLWKLEVRLNRSRDSPLPLCPLSGFSPAQAFQLTGDVHHPRYVLRRQFVLRDSLQGFECLGQHRLGYADMVLHHARYSLCQFLPGLPIHLIIPSGYTLLPVPFPAPLLERSV